ncbi:PREDICTED: protein virilizer isoform X2 [Nicrophorus vespilloides]|uniref:Protein virilizer isoform X2 n=1 Tax=Nicrophorus vespilloides TaxID=110193 RepID=A0ABM1MWW4_NICVS|nr:PREDICTED: protein virilizer isoform X2 [Nicrophorus vespilloides]
MADLVELLFFDTFAHENTEELNLDLVQFPKPVYVTEVRIIPLGARVQADFPGGVRLGATNPSQFQIEFFVNDLGKPGASTFETLGGFEYNQNGCINLNCLPNDTVRKIPTDGLVLRGWYTTITLAVYGTLTANITEQIIPPVVTPSLPAQPNTISDVQQIISQNPIENDWQEPIQQVPMEYNQQTATQYPQPYVSQENYQQENYGEYYGEAPKDPRSYHHTPETDWDNKGRSRPSETENTREQRTRDAPSYPQKPEVEQSERRERRYSRSHSKDRNYRETSRDKEQDRDWDHGYREHDKDWDGRDRDRYKHSDNYRRYNDREERKRPRTPPPVHSPKRPHTPQSDNAKASPKEMDILSEEEVERQKMETSKKEVEKMSVVEESSNTMDVEEFEPILSDEDILDDAENFQDEYDYNGYTNNDDIIKLFIPGQTPLQHYKRKTSFELDNGNLVVDEHLKTIIGIVDDFFKSSITKYTTKDFQRMNGQIKEEFVHLCEKVMQMFEGNFCVIAQMYSVCAGARDEISTQVEFIIDTLVNWLKVALDFDMANEQEQPGYKIRHIKCGVKLAEWVSSSADFLKVLWRNNVYIHQSLINLYESEFMALSIKLMILKALDTYLLKKESVEVFLCGRFSENSEYSFENSVGYKVLISMLEKNPSVRLKFALNSILKKMNCFEVLERTKEVLKNICEQETLTKEDSVFLQDSLSYVLNLIQAGSFSVSQPKRFLPVVTQFEINRNENDANLVELFRRQHLLEMLLLLLTHCSTMISSNIKTVVYEILAELSQSLDGLKYMSENDEVINALVKVLLVGDEEFPLESDLRSHNLGLKLAYELQALCHVDNLKQFKDCECNEVVDQLHGLFCLSFNNVGKLAVGKVLSYGDNLSNLLQFIDLKSEAKMRKSPAVAYIIDLLNLVIVCFGDIPLLEKYRKKLLDISAASEIFEKLGDMTNYLRPYENFKGSYDVAELVDCICKQQVTNFSGILITCLRILEHIGISKHDNKTPLENPLSNFSELKYKHVILQLYPLDGVGLLLRILGELCDFYEQPSLHNSTFVSSQGILIINIIEPCIKLLKQMLTYVIQCRNTHFKDLTAIQILLQTYNLCQSFPVTALGFHKSRKLCQEIVDTLLVYTQPVSEEIHEKDSLNKTLWTLMCGEVIKFTMSAPYAFIAGLSVFSEMLPLPLPVQTSEELSAEEISWAVNLRKLWSAHLHSHSSSIQDMIAKLCTTTYQPLLNLLRKICAQISDLAANSALMIARGILDNVHGAIVLNDDTKKLVCNGYIARLMNFLACLVTHGSLKCTFLHLLANSSGGKGDEKYPAIILAFAQILRSTSNVNSHVQTQECILSILQSFCDTEITLYQNSTSDIYLANALPVKDHVLVFLNTMLEHISGENLFITYLPVVRTLLLLTEHDYGFYHLREVLLKRPNIFRNVLQKLEQNFSKDNGECLSTLNTLVEFLRVCSEPELVEEGMVVQPRTMKMDIQDIQALVGWEDNTENHPLIKLEEKLKVEVQEDSTFEGLLESIELMLTYLRVKGDSEVKEITYVEQVLPSPEPLLAQFAGRPIFSTRDSLDDRLTASYWLTPLGVDDQLPQDACEPDNVTCDLADVCRQDLASEVNLIKQVEKLCRVCPSESIEQVEKEKRINTQKDKMKRPFVTPVRGRGFARTIQVRSDLFRSRPPNTSRPPSLHVDDFVALETCGAQPTGPTGYNRISRELLATSRVARGPRGRSFIASDRAVQYRQMSWWGPGRVPY